MLIEKPTIQNYVGFNPYLNKLRQQYEFTEFEQSYIDQNLLFRGLDIDVELKVGRQTCQSLCKQFKVQKEFETVKIDKLWGETDQVYHFGYNSHDFFCLKEDTEDPYMKRLKSYPVDLKYWNSRFKDGKELFPYQVDGIKFIKSMRHSFNLDDMGLGKTIQSIIGVLESGCKKILVVTLASTKINWRREINNLGYTAKVVSGSKISDEPTDFTIINFEILKNFDFQTEQYDALIVDECHRVKNPTSLQSKHITKISQARSIKKVIGLSGTLIEKNIDFYNICRSMSMNVETLTCNKAKYFKEIKKCYEEYAARYSNAFEMPYETPKAKADKVQILDQLPVEFAVHHNIKSVLTRIQQTGENKKGQWYAMGKKISEYNIGDITQILRMDFEDKRRKIFILKENTNTKELRQRAKGWIIRRKKEEVLKYFPEKVVYPIFSTLSLQQKKEYNTLWEEYLAEIGKKEVKDQSASVKVRQFFALVKCPNTLDFVERKIETNNKIILYTHFKEEFDYFVDKLGEVAVHIHASMIAEKKQAVIDKFQKDENIRVIIGNIKTLGTGHNITAANITVTNSPNWNSGEHEQSEDRAYRLGQTKDVTSFYMLLEGTHEEDVWNKSQEKGTNKQLFFN